jgi:hypothetical protein
MKFLCFFFFLFSRFFFLNKFKSNQSNPTSLPPPRSLAECPVCLEATVLPPTPCEVACAADGTEPPAGCVAMCVGCTHHAINQSITERAFGVAPVKCPGPCRTRVPLHAWRPFTLPTATAADIELAMRTLTIAADADADAGADTTTGAAATGTLTPAEHAFNQAATAVTRFRCPSCDQTQSFIDSVPQLGRRETACDVTAQRAVAKKELQVAALASPLGARAWRDLCRASRRFARYEDGAATALACATANIAFATADYSPETERKNRLAWLAVEERCWSNKARAVAWNVLSLCPDAERRAALALALAKEVPQLTLEDCCYQTVCLHCAGDDPHWGQTCAEYESTQERMRDDEASSYNNDGSGDDLKVCVSCGVTLFRSEGCDDITCPACEAVFCWTDADAP